MNPITNIIPEALTHALGWTLLHSLWQGAFVALLLGLLLVLLHRHSAATRYAVAGGALLAQLLLAAGTFLYYYSQPDPGVPLAPAQARAVAATEVQAAAPASFWSAPFEAGQAYFEQHMPLLVTLWLLGMLLMALRFLGGLAYTRRLRHLSTSPLGAYWQQKAETLAQAMGMRQAIQLMESAVVQVPMAIGFAKPVILLPVGAVTGLTQAQVEAVLAHELAHILRKDYLVNLLQSVVDMLFFYHPAVWWVSGVVRAERENCCDDMAVAVCGDTLLYARALAGIEAMRLPVAPATAVAFSGNRGSLMNRIRRLVGQPSLKPTFTEGFAAALVLVVGLLVLSFGAVAGLQPQEEEDAVKLAQRIASVTPPAAVEGIAEAGEAFSYAVQDSTGNTRDIVIIKNKKGKVKELYVDGKRIPNRHIDEYESLINQRLQAVNDAPRATREEVAAELRAARAAAREARSSNREASASQFDFSDHQFDFSDFQFDFSGFDTLVPPPPPPLPPMPPMPPVPPAPPIVPPVPPVAPATDDKEALKEYRQELQEYEEELKNYEEEIKEFEKEMEKLAKLYGSEITLQAAEKLAKQYGSGMTLQAAGKLAKEYGSEATLQAATQQKMARQQQELAMEHRKMAQKHEEQFRKVKAELVKDGILKKDEESLNIRIDNSDLYVNDRKQPKKVYEKYRKLLNIGQDDSSDFRYQFKSD